MIEVKNIQKSFDGKIIIQDVSAVMKAGQCNLIIGASGLAAARRLQPTLILLDMQLPDTDGHAVLR
ncbi:MAG TPA: ABC transporter ATP-binding protein, partial [Chitinophagaceae bacterium]|nr:ABC transporter ATP-binding protein [Chitinophagaceae bacterium]